MSRESERGAFYRVRKSLGYQDKLRGYYAPLIRQHAEEPWKAMGWGSAKGQKTRFELLAHAAADADCETVLDVGCGCGDFCFGWPRDSYTGIDIIPEMIVQAKMRHPMAAEFLVCDILQPPGLGDRRFDAVVASGVFGLKIGCAYSSTMIAAMWKYAGKMLAFNMLSTELPKGEQLDQEAYYDAGEILAFCQTLTPFVKADHSYRLNDFTICMYREQQG